MSKIFSIEILADLETPVSAYLKLKSVGACFLLESTENNESFGRYSFIGLNPVLRVGLEKGAGSLSFLRKYIKPSSKDMPVRPNDCQVGQALLSGLVGYIGYEVCGLFENVPQPASDHLNLPPVYLIRPETIIVFDHYRKKIGIFTINRQRIDEIIRAFNTALPKDIYHKDKKGAKKPVSNFTSGRYQQIVRQAKEYIRAGDIFQVVLSQRFTGETAAAPFQVYRAMRLINPSPYMFFFEQDDFCLVGSSPEMLTKLQGREVLLRPIAGTKQRGQTYQEDMELEKKLLANSKENAEHSMLVDLGRNDLGRVCEFSSINLKEHKKIERYSHVMHMVSTVTGLLKKDKDMFDLFQAAFPAGTVTGAPKIRAMEIISKLEKTRRGPYAGAMGYFGGNGNMDMCLTIRTIVFKGNKYFVQAGAGIVYDSNPLQEYQETLNKMAVLRKAIEIAEKGDGL